MFFVFTVRLVTDEHLNLVGFGSPVEEKIGDGENTRLNQTSSDFEGGREGESVEDLFQFDFHNPSLFSLW